MGRRGWQIAITIIAVIFLLLHLFCPTLKIDAISLTLLAICLVPWLGELFKSLEIPGGWKFEFQDFKKAAEKAEASGLLAPVEDTTSEPIYYSLIDTDPRLAITGLRIDIETKLRAIAAQQQLNLKPAGIFQLMTQMEKAGILSTTELSALKDILSSLNSAAHGAEIPKEQAVQVMKIGQELLESLKKRYQPTS